jgi:hypothetical protein
VDEQIQKQLKSLQDENKKLSQQLIQLKSMKSENETSQMRDLLLEIVS